MRRAAAPALLFLAILGLAIAGCGGFFNDTTNNGGTGATPHFAYVSNSGSLSLSAYTVNTTTGVLTAMSGVPALGGIAASGSNTIVSDTNGNFLFVALGVASNNLVGFAIDHTTGALTAVPGSPYTAGSGALVAVALDQSDRFLYAVDTASKVFAFTVNSTTGQLTALGTAQPVGGLATGLLIDPSGRFVYASFAGGIDVFTVNGDGSLTPQTGVTTSSGCIAFQSILVEPTVHFLYAVDGQSSGNVCGFKINSANGTLSPLVPLLTAADNTPVALAVDHTGSFLFVADKGSNKLSEYLITNTGGLSQFSGSPLSVGASPTAVAVDPSASFLYVVNAGSNTVSLFGLTTAGALTPTTSNSGTGTAPSAMVVAP